MKPLLRLCLFSLGAFLCSTTAHADYQKFVLDDKPVAYWRFSDANGTKIANAGTLGAQADGVISGKARFAQAGPRPTTFPDFETENKSVEFAGKDGFIRVKDAGSSLAFKQGETITIEAWVNPNSFKDGQDIYIIGKGRTKNAGFAANNQNWGLRLRGVSGSAHLSFLFRDARNLPNSEDCWHRWVSDLAFTADDNWHRVVVTYTFGKGDSMRGWIDDEETKGKWDYGGKTDLAPVVDGDEVWIGSSQGGQAASTFTGGIDEVAIYRSAPKADQLALRYNVNTPATAVAAAINVNDLPKDAVRIQILEHAKADKAENPASVGNDSGDTAKPPPSKEVSWKMLPVKVTDEFVQPLFGLGALPTKYNSKGIRADRSAPFLLRAAAQLTLPAGEHRILLRSHHGARLSIDGQVLVTTPFANAKYSDAEEVPDQAAKSIDGARVLPPGHNDEVATFKSDGKAKLFVLEAFVGGRKLRPEVGELCVAVAGKDGQYQLLSPKLQIALSDEGWEPYAAAQKAELAERDVVQRRVVSTEEDKYWAKRHDLARQVAKPAPAVPALPSGLKANNAVDNFIATRLAAAKVSPTALLDDDSFLRRVTLDTTGLIPSPEQIAAFKKDTSPDRRKKAVDRLLSNPGWADHWVSYWQDVLAENPGMLKPTLNNTGPFRWFIYDSMRDNKPVDRFATELVQMEGSLYFGGAAGFSMASENDVPMAAKAHIISKAFLGMELQCARCHDAPYHPFKQEELFSLAAMLKRAPEKVPMSSSIPTNANVKIGRLVEVTLAPGSVVKPAWPFAKFSDPSRVEKLLRNHEDSREELAALMTDPGNERFPKVIVNRVWKRYLGWGLVEPVDDWATNPQASHPELLDWLARELVTSGYDLKHVAGLILNSQAYQRVAKATSMEVPKPEERLFEAPARRRLTAEQVVDSLFAAVGKQLGSEELNQDVDGRRPIEDFSNLGAPKRAWEFCSLANERDRPALALPRAQAIVDTLMMFGWRESRPNPMTVRDDSPNVLQPANLANSTLASRVVRLSDDSAMTKLALDQRPLPDLIQAAFQRVLSRPPTASELAMFTAHLERGFADRVVPVTAAKKKAGPKHAVSWSNHLNAEATKIKLEQEKEARAGDPPTLALKPEWRERMEDMVWAMVNTPEFIFVP